MIFFIFKIKVKLLINVILKYCLFTSGLHSPIRSTNKTRSLLKKKPALSMPRSLSLALISVFCSAAKRCRSLFEFHTEVRLSSLLVYMNVRVRNAAPEQLYNVRSIQSLVNLRSARYNKRKGSSSAAATATAAATTTTVAEIATAAERSALLQQFGRQWWLQQWNQSRPVSVSSQRSWRQQQRSALCRSATVSVLRASRECACAS